METSNNMIGNSEISIIESLAMENESYRQFTIEVYELIQMIKSKREFPFKVKDKYNHNLLCNIVINELFDIAKQKDDEKDDK